MRRLFTDKRDNKIIETLTAMEIAAVINVHYNDNCSYLYLVFMPLCFLQFSIQYCVRINRIKYGVSE